MLNVLYLDSAIAVCEKPVGVLSTDEPGGMPDLLRQALGIPDADVRTVHRLDRVVGGLMVLARNAAAASELSRQIREGNFRKEYLAVLHGKPEQNEGELRDLLGRDKARKMTYVSEYPGKDVREAILFYRVVGHAENITCVKIQLQTGRTHQIRVQFASRGMPLVGERKYSTLEDSCSLALWSSRLQFSHPISGDAMDFSLRSPERFPWTIVSPV